MPLLPTPRALRAAVTVVVTGAALVVPVALAAPAHAATPPTVTAVTPTSGTVNGGTAVTVTGTGFTGATSVKFGTFPAAAFRVVSATTVTATAPPGNLGPVDIRVTTRSGVSAVVAADRHTYVGGYRLTGTNRRGDVTASSVLSIAGGTCTGATCSATTVGAHTVTATSGGTSTTATLRVANPAAPRR